MGLRIQNNIAALNTHRQLQISDLALSKSLERLSSGFRINRAADDAAGLSVSMKFRAQIRSLQQASRNANEANALLQVAEGGADQISNILSRMKELATQAASSNTTSGDRANISTEVNTLKSEIDRIAASTKYGTTSLIDGSFVNSTFQVGSENNADNQITFSLGDMRTGTAGLNVDVDVSTQSGAQVALTTIDTAISTLADRRSTIGVMQNRFGFTIANIATSVENITAAESVIRDSDLAFETIAFTKNQILLQAGTAMLAQANLAPQFLLGLLG
ncbi:MAG: flagellin [Thermodesulfobacteriota bacterium]